MPLERGCISAMAAPISASLTSLSSYSPKEISPNSAYDKASRSFLTDSSPMSRKSLKRECPLFYVVNQKCQLALSLKAKRKNIYEKQSRRKTQSSFGIGANF